MLVVSLSGFVSILFGLIENSDSDFNHLGRDLLGGFAVAVIVAIGLAVFQVRRRDKEQPPRFISITQRDHVGRVNTNQDNGD